MGEVVLFGILALVAFVLSLGPTGWRAFYAFCFDHVFGFQAIRAPARFAVLVQFSLAAIAARGASALTTRVSGATRVVLPMALGAVILLEYGNRPIPYAARPDFGDPAAHWLGGQRERGPVLELPIEADTGATQYMVNSFAHWMPLVNGESGQRPEYYISVVDAMRRFPGPEALTVIRELGVRYIVVHGDRMPAGSPVPGPPLVARARFGSERVFEVVWSAETEAAIAPPPTGTPPPSAGAVSFAGERLEYNASWSAFVTAGQVRLEADQEEIAPRQRGYRFRVTAETAPWISNFYEARDEFLAFSDAHTLLPLRTERHLREGRRQVDDGVTFDRARGIARVKNAIGFRLAPHTRDAVSALYYARSLPLAPGQRVTIPVSEQGRSLLVDLEVQGRERVRVPAGEFAAVRVLPHIGRQAYLKAPLDAQLWLTDDERHVPLRMDATAGFGRVRLELTKIGTPAR